MLCDETLERKSLRVEAIYALILIEHDLFGKPIFTFPYRALVRPVRAQFHAAKAQFAAGKTRCKNAECEKKFTPVDHELQRIFRRERDRKKLSLRQKSVGVVDNIDHEFVGWARRDTRHGKIESRIVTSSWVPQVGAKDEVAIGRLKIEDQGFAVAKSVEGAHNVDRDQRGVGIGSFRTVIEVPGDRLAGPRSLGKRTEFFRMCDNFAFAESRFAAGQKDSRGLQFGQSTPSARFQIGLH